MSYGDLLTCSDAQYLTRCHLGSFSNRCHFFRTTCPAARYRTKEKLSCGSIGFILCFLTPDAFISRGSRLRSPVGISSS